MRWFFSLFQCLGMLCFGFLLVFTNCTEQPTKGKPSKWTAVNDGLPATISVLDIAYSQNNSTIIYIGTYSGIYRKEDNNAWVSVQNGLPLKHISAVAVSPARPDEVYCGTWGRGLFYSSDGGQTWNDIWPQQASPHITHICLSETDKVWIGTEQGIYQSSDGGQTWQHVMKQGSVKIVSVHPQYPDIVYAGVDIKGNFKSVDAGQTWQAMNQGIHHNNESTAAANSFVFHIDSGNTVLMSTGWVDIFKSVNSGNSWVKTGDLLTDLNVEALIQDPLQPKRYWAATQYKGVFASTNNAVSWNAMNNGFPDVETQTVRIHDLTLVAGNDNLMLYAGLNSYGIYKYKIE